VGITWTTVKGANKGWRKAGKGHGEELMEKHKAKLRKQYSAHANWW